MQKKCKVLFFSHSASRNGATIFLLHFLKWLRSNSPLQFDVLINGPGELVDDFRSLAPVRVRRSGDKLLAYIHPRYRERVRAIYARHTVRQISASGEYHLVYLNTAALSWLIPHLVGKATPVAWHFHEMAHVLELLMGKSSIPRPKHLVACSKFVRQALAERFQVPEEQVDTIYEFIPRVVSSDDQHRTEKRTTVRQRLGIPLDEFVVGGCGSLGWRKGSDLFLQIARKAADAATSRELHFVWVGGSPGSSEFLEFMHDLRRLGLTGRCQLVPCTASVGDYYFAMDVFALTSREDPFPLVMLEAGAASLPVICFENSGGGPEFITEDAGLMAAYLDIESFVEKLMLLVSNESFCKTVGRNAAAKVERNFTVDVVAPKLLGNLLRYTGQSMGPSQIGLNTVSACAS